MIKEIPKYLLQNCPDILFDRPVQPDYSALPSILMEDIEFLSGVVPVTDKILNLWPKVGSKKIKYGDKLNADEIKYYEKRKAIFQMVNIVFNFYDFKILEDRILARPFNITLLPSWKRDKLTYRNIDLVKNMDLENFEKKFYCWGYDPFQFEKVSFWNILPSGKCNL